jgi:hypothetical protein
VRAGIQELSVKGDIIVAEGFYEIKFAGSDGTGSGVIVLKDGRLVGTDGRLDYDGTYAVTGLGQVQANIRCTSRPGRGFLQRPPFEMSATFLAGGSTPITLPGFGSPLGSPLDATISYMRGLS